MVWNDLAVPFSAAGLFLLACLSPGPVWAVITTTALRQSPAKAALTGLGVASASLTWASLTMLGLGQVIARLEGVYLVLRLLGAAYLIVLGLAMLRAAMGKNVMVQQGQIEAPRLGAGAAFRRGYMTSITNPKAAAFFSSLFVVVLPPDLTVSLRVLTVVLIGAASALWHCSLALVFLAPAVQQGYRRLKRGIDAVTGAVLVGLGVRLALSR
jgi:threonine efflux protein